MNGASAAMTLMLSQQHVTFRSVCVESELMGYDNKSCQRSYLWMRYKKHNKKGRVKKTCIIRHVKWIKSWAAQYNASFLWYWCYICNNLELFALLASMHCWLAVFLLHVGLRILNNFKKKKEILLGLAVTIHTLLFQAVSLMFPQPSVCHIPA